MSAYAFQDMTFSAEPFEEVGVVHSHIMLIIADALAH